jgi:hypothetical protein
MGTINQGYYDRVRYVLFNEVFGSITTIEPVGWNDDEKELVRDETYFGVISKFSNNLKFIGDASNFIQMIYDILGVNAQIRLTKDVKNSKTDVWERAYEGYLDMWTYERENNQVSLKFNSGGLEQILKNRANEQVEVERTTALDNSTIDELNPVNVKIDGRRIFLKTKYEKDSSTNLITLDVQSDSGNTRRATTGFPLKLINKSHESAQSVIYDSEGTDVAGTNGIMFFAISDRYRVLRVKGEKIQFKPIITAWDFDWAIVSVCLTTYKDGFDYNLKSRDYLFSSQSLSGDSFDQIVQTHNQLRELNFDKNINLLPGESLALEFYIESDLSSGSNRHFRVDFTEMTGNLFIEEDSFFEPSTTKAILAHELAERLINIYTGKSDLLYSEFLGRTDINYPVDGKGSFTAVAHGFWLRGFDKIPIPVEGPPKIENLYKPMTTSLNDLMTTLEAVWNVGMGIEKVGLKERVRIEDKRFFFNRNVINRLPYQVKNVKRTVASNYYYSALEFGYEKGGNYEEACGLDEYNIKTNFTTCINRKSDYSKVGKYRADKYGAEFCRRKPKSLNDTIDTPYDLDNFLFDLKRNGLGGYDERKWQDDFAIEPTGVFSPETATNFRFSPFNCLLRHSWWFSSGLKLYPNDYVIYSSSLANSNLKTKLIGGNEYAENGKIQNSNLPSGHFFPEWVEFEHICNDDIMKMVEGKTIVNGKEISNFYGLFEYKNEKGLLEKGFLFNLKPNGKGKWKVLKF